MGNKKRMYKKGSFLEPSKELKFGGMKYQAGKPPVTKADPKKAPDYRMTPDKTTQIGGEAMARRGMSREEKQNMQQGSSAKTQRANLKPRTESRPAATTSGIAGSKAPGRPLNQGTKGTPVKKSPAPAEKSTATKKAGEKGTYAYAKKRNPNLDKLIAERKKYDKGSAEYKRIQMQINDAYYGTGALRKPMEKASIPAPKPIARKTNTSSKKSPQASKAAAKTTPKQTPSGGSGMGAVQREAALKNEINSAKPVDRRTSASSAKSSSSTSVADLKSQIKDARKANRQGRKNNRQAGKISRLEERLAKLQNKKMEPGGLKPAPNRGAASLPKKVRNKMGFMKRGGRR